MNAAADHVVPMTDPHVATVSDAQPSGWLAFMRIPEAAIGSIIGVLMLGLILVGPWLAPYDPTEVGVGLPGSGPSGDHLLGTDGLGRDVFSRLLTGGISGLVIPIIAVAVCFATGGVMGMTAGYVGGRFDAVLTRVVDIALALPAIMMVLLIMAGFGTSYGVVIVTIAVVNIPGMYRILRGATQAISPSDYVQAARIRGESSSWIVRRELLPNIAATLLVDLALRTVYAVTFFATLSFLGLGAQPPSSNWGVMVSENRGLIVSAPLSVLAPTAAIALLAVSINLFADGLTRHLSGDVNRMAWL